MGLFCTVSKIQRDIGPKVEYFSHCTLIIIPHWVAPLGTVNAWWNQNKNRMMGSHGWEKKRYYFLSRSDTIHWVRNGRTPATASTVIITRIITGLYMLWGDCTYNARSQYVGRDCRNNNNNNTNIYKLHKVTIKSWIWGANHISNHCRKRNSGTAGVWLQSLDNVG